MSTSDPQPLPSDRGPIQLRVADKKAYVWDVEDVARIRSEYRLCGVLSGTLPHLSQQNVFLGIPLVLLPEEAVLLVELGAAVLIDDPTAHSVPPSHLQLKSWSDEQQEGIRRQISAMRDKETTGNAASMANSEEAQRKRREREERKRAAAAKALAEARAGNEESLFIPAASAETESASTSALVTTQSFEPFQPQSQSQASLPYTILIPAPSSTLPWYSPTHASYSSIESARKAGVWTYPSTRDERARCGVFRGLWEQGYYMGVGIKFGGEYLVYPGDPLRYHSHFVATVHPSPTSTLRPMEIVAHGRLGTATKKSHLLCGWDDEKKEASFLSVEWAGFG